MNVSAWLAVLATLGFGVLLTFSLKDVARMWVELREAEEEGDLG